MRIAVVGSSFSGIAAAHALTARGFAVTILDVGETLDAQRTAIVQKFRDLPSESWPQDEFRIIDENPTLGRHMLPKKVHFGSEYIYANDRSFAPIVSGPGKRLPYPTFARAGYSNIWGAAVLAPDACDMADWPVSHAEMQPFFREAAKLIPLSGGEGTLDTAFPSYKDELGDIDPGPQGSALLEDLRRAESELTNDRLLYGRARLAIHTEAAPGALPCNNCGYCFTGCVRGSIFSTEPLLERMMQFGRVTYEPGQFVDVVREAEGKVIVEVVNVATSAHRMLFFDAVFLAAGPINTTRLLLRSFGVYDRPILLKESQKFVIPMLRRRAAETAVERPSVTIASVFIEAKVPAVSDHWVHVQVIPMNALMLKGSAIPEFARLTPILRRTMAAWCGMHSDDSAQVELRLHKPDSSRRAALEINVRDSRAARKAAHRVGKHFFREGFKFGSLFLHPMMQFSEPGSGTHCGASFPMRERRTSHFETDILGRPFGWSRVYAVDATVLPSIPGTTLAFPVMANAYRIGTFAPVVAAVN